MSIPRHTHTLLTAGLAALSLAAVFIRYAQAPGLIVAAYQMLLASVFLLPVTYAALKKTPLKTNNSIYAILAGIFLGLYVIFWISSLSYTSVAASISLSATQPIWIALFGWVFLGLAPSFMLLLGVLIAVAGGAMIGFGDGTVALLGDLLALLGAICSAAYILLGRSAQKRGLSLQAYIGVARGVAAVILLPFPFIVGLPYFDYSSKSFFWIGLLALVSQVIGSSSINYSLRHLNPKFVATVMLLEPLIASLLALLLLHEFPSATTILGGILLLTGIGFSISAPSQLTKSINNFR